MLVPPFIRISSAPISSTHGVERLPRGFGHSRLPPRPRAFWYGFLVENCVARLTALAQHRGQPAAQRCSVFHSLTEMVRRGRKTSRIGAGDSGSLIWTERTLSYTFQMEAAPMGRPWAKQ